MKIYFAIILFILFSQNAQSQIDDLNSIAKKYRKEYKIPGLAISVIKSDTIFYGVAGVKRCENSDKIALDSKFQIGSNAKAITATIAARLVEEQKINWESKITEIIPELKGIIREEYKSISLKDLLSNRGKIQPFEDDGSQEWKNLPKSISNSTNSKLQFAKYALNLTPKIDLKKGFSYSNGGFIIAGLMLERCSGNSWKKLIEQFNQDFEVEAILGFPNQHLSTDTYGHKKKFGRYKSISPMKEYDFKFDFSPAGNLSISISDLSKLISKHLDGLLGNSNVLSADTYTKLHYGFEKYALGWYNGNIGDTSQKFSYHGGSLETFSSAIMTSADREVAIIILINSDDKKTNELKNKLRIELWKKYGSQ